MDILLEDGIRVLPLELVGAHVVPFLSRQSLNSLRLTGKVIQSTIPSPVQEAPPWPETQLKKNGMVGVSEGNPMPEWPLSLLFSPTTARTTTIEEVCTTPTTDADSSGVEKKTKNDNLHPPPPILACIDESGLIHVWQATNGKHKILDDGAATLSIALIPNNSRISSASLLVSGCVDGSIRLWDIRKGVIIKPPLQQQYPSEDGNDNNLPPSSNVFKIWIGHGSPVCAVGVSSDGAILASSGLEGTIRLWNLQSSSWINNSNLVLPPPEIAIIRPDDIPALDPGELPRRGIAPVVSTLVFSPTITITSSTVREPQNENNNNNSSCSEIGHCLASVADSESCIRLWKIVSTRLSNQSSPSSILPASRYTLWRTFKTLTYRKKKDGDGETSHISLAWSPCGKFLVSTGVRGPIQLWNIDNGTCLGILLSPSACSNTSLGGVVSHVAISPHIPHDEEGPSPREDSNSLVIALGMLGGRVSLWNVSISKCHSNDVGSDSDNNNNNNNNSICSEDEITNKESDGNDDCIDERKDRPIATSSLLRDLPPRKIPFPILSLAFTSDGRTLAASSRDGIRLWSTLSSNVPTPPMTDDHHFQQPR